MLPTHSALESRIAELEAENERLRAARDAIGDTSSRLDAYFRGYREGAEDGAYSPNFAKQMADARAAALEEAMRCCEAFDGPASDSDFCNGQATAAQQIRAAIRALKDKPNE